jgi:PadR family transcriptional regulator PadR
MYGYQLLREMDKRSSGYFRLKEGTLYPALHRLARVGLVRSEWTKSPNGQLRRYYHLTQVGYEKLRSILREWDLFTKAVSLVSGSVGSLARSVLKAR